jgi:hypothetical protein
LPVDVNAPDGAVVAVVGAQALAVQREPHVRLLVLGGGEEQVALAVVLDLRDRTLVALQENRSLFVLGIYNIGINYNLNLFLSIRKLLNSPTNHDYVYMLEFLLFSREKKSINLNLSEKKRNKF